MKHPLRVLLALFAVLAIALAAWRWRAGDSSGAESESGDGAELAAEPVFVDELVARPSEPTPMAAGAPRDVALEPERAEAATTPPSPPPKASTQLVGRVMDSQGRPVEGARVLAALSTQGPALPLEAEVWGESWRKRRETKSTADGRFLLDDVGAGITRVAVRLDSAAPLDIDGIVVVESLVNDVGEFVVQPGVRIVGSVVDARGSPVAGALILRPFDAQNPSFREKAAATGLTLGVSDGAGRFDVGGLAAGPWVLLVHHDNYPDAIARAEDSAPGDVVAGVRIELEVSATVQGSLQALPGARTPNFDSFTISASYTGARERVPGEPENSQRRVRCNADGSFELGGLRADEPYRLSVVWHRTKDDSGGTEVPGSGRDIVADGSRVDFVLQPFSVLVHRPVDAVSGNPVEGLDGRLVARAADGREYGVLSTTRSDGDGVWSETSAQLPANNDALSLIVTHEAYRPTRITPVALALGATTDAGRVQMEPLGELRVRVLSADTGEPIRGARVMAELRTGDDGTRSLEDLAANPRRGSEPQRVRGRETDEQGYCTLYASLGATGYACATHRDWPASELVEVRFVARGSAAVDLYINPGADARVRVVDPLGVAVPGVAVSATWRVPDVGSTAESLRSGWRVKLTDAEGIAAFTRLTPGSTSFALWEDRVGGTRSASERDATKLTITVTPERVAELQLVATPRGNLRGRVLDAGRPLAGASIVLRPTGAQDQGRWQTVREVSLRTDSDGRYSIQRLGAGLWDVTIRHPARLVTHSERLDFDGRDRELDFRLSGTAIAGTVRDMRGRPIEGARIVLGTLKPDPRNKDSKSWNPVSTNLRVLSDAMGLFELRGVPDSIELQVAVDHPEYQGARSEAFQLAPDELRAGVDFTLRAGAILLIEVEANDGRVVRAQVSAQRIADEKGKNVRSGPRSQRLDGRSRARFTGLAGGRYRVFLDRPFAGQDAPSSTVVEVEAGREETVRLRVP
jgi:uncharacterized GH25 family protein